MNANQTQTNAQELLTLLWSLPECRHNHCHGPATYNHTDPCPDRLEAFCGNRDWNDAQLALGFPDSTSPLGRALWLAAYERRAPTTATFAGRQFLQSVDRMVGLRLEPSLLNRNVVVWARDNADGSRIEYPSGRKDVA